MDFEIELEENTYNAGETAKGILLIYADKSLKVRKLKFSVCGKERYEERGVSGSWAERWVEKCDIANNNEAVVKLTKKRAKG